MKKKRDLLVMSLSLIFSALIFLSSCSPKSSEINPLSTFTPMAVLTPAAGTAIIGGNLIDKATNKPPIEGTLFLGEVTLMTNGKPIVPLDRMNDAYALLGPNGDFVFQNIKPGKYGLIFYTPELNFLIDDPKGNGSLILDINSDEVIDVGKIEIALK
jgi:hypothetical protein